MNDAIGLDRDDEHNAIAFYDTGELTSLITTGHDKACDEDERSRLNVN